MKLEEMKIQDVIETKEFRKNVEYEINSVEESYRVFRMHHGEPKRNPMMAIMDKGLLKSIDLFIVNYVACLNRKSRLSSNERASVFAIGNAAYNKTIRIMLENERKAKDNNGEDK